MLAMMDFWTEDIMGSESESVGGCSGRVPETPRAFFEEALCQALPPPPSILYYNFQFKLHTTL
jgi:hypothetical protein